MMLMNQLQAAARQITSTMHLAEGHHVASGQASWSDHGRAAYATLQWEINVLGQLECACACERTLLCLSCHCRGSH